MFAVNEILNFGTGRRQEALDRLAWIHGLMVKHQGFKHAMVAKYMGDVTRHTIMRFWEDEESFKAFRATDDGNYGRGRPEGLYETVRVITPLLGIGAGEAAGNEPSGNFLVKIQQEVPEDGWDAYNQFATGMMSMAKNIPGLVWVREFRAQNESQALIVARYRDRKAFEDLTESPDFIQGMKRMPEGVKPVSTMCFEVVSDVYP